MSKLYIIFIAVLTVASLAFATENYQFSWSSQQDASQSDFEVQAAGYGLPDSVLQIKNVRANISDKELKALRLLATQLLGYTNPALVKAIKVGELIEVKEDG